MNARWLLLLLPLILADCSGSPTNRATESLVQVTTGVAVLQQGDAAAALRLFDGALARDDLTARQQAGVDVDRAVAMRRRHDSSGALAALDLAIRLDDKSVDAYYDRALVHDERGETDRALADYDAALRLRPEFAEGFIARGMTHARLGQVDLAKADFDAASRIKGYLPAPALGRAIVALREGDAAQALADCATAVRIGHDDPQVFLVCGQIKLALDRPAEAADDLRHSLQVDRRQEDATIWLHVARIAQHQDDREAFAAAAAGLGDGFPAIAAKLFFGHLTADQLTAAAGADVAPKQATCEAAIFLAADGLARRPGPAAQDTWREAEKACPPVVPRPIVIVP